MMPVMGSGKNVMWLTECIGSIAVLEQMALTPNRGSTHYWLFIYIVYMITTLQHYFISYHN